MPLNGDMAFVSVDTKRAQKVDFRGPISSFIAKEFGEPPEGFYQALDELISQRHACIERAPEKHESGLRAVMKYYGVLQCLTKRFPMKTAEEWDGVSTMPINIKFEWDDTLAGSSLFAKKSVGLVDINFELINVLYNIGAVHSQIGAATNTSSDSGLKNASINFQNAAVVFNSVATLVHKYYSKAPSGDLDPNYLSALSFLMLAQAQEMFWKKCVVERKSNGIISKLAKQTSAFYNDSFRNMSLAGDLDKTWMKISEAKGAYYEADAHYRRALDEIEEDAYGAAIARLKLALSRLSETSKAAAASGFKTSSLEENIRMKLKDAEKENGVIYMQPLPKTNALPALDQAATVSAEKELPDYTSEEYIGKDPFENVVPLAVNQAVTRYRQRREEHIANTTSQLEDCTRESVDKLVSMGLPGSLQAVENPDTVPEMLLQHAAEIRNQGGPGALKASIESLPDRSSTCKDMIKDILSSLDSEQKEDGELRAKYGSKWGRETSEKLNAQMRKEVAKLSNAVDQASAGDETVLTRFQEIEPALNFLIQDEESIKAALPSASGSTSSGDDGAGDAVAELLDILTQLDKLRAERDAVAQKYEDIKAKDDISGVLIARQGEEESGIFSEQMQLYVNVDEEAKRLIAETNDLIAKCENANERFVASKTETSDREVMLNDLNAKVETWRTLSRDIAEGAKFYEQVSGLLARQQAKCNDFCVARDLEKQDLLSSITREIARAPSDDYQSHFTPPSSSTSSTIQPPQSQTYQPTAPSSYQPPYQQQQQQQPSPYGNYQQQQQPQQQQYGSYHQPQYSSYQPPQQQYQPPQYQQQPQQYHSAPRPYQQPYTQGFNFQQGFPQPPSQAPQYHQQQHQQHQQQQQQQQQPHSQQQQYFGGNQFPPSY